MLLIVDTYNVLHVVGVLPADIAGVDTADLIDLLRRSRYRGQRVILVCDGVPRPETPQGRLGSISVHYAGHGTTADDRIAAIIRRSSAPRRLTIVSSDRAVLRAGRRRRCSTLDSAAFLRQLADDHRHAAASDEKPADPLDSALPAVLPPELIAEAELLAELESAAEEPAERAPEAAGPEPAGPEPASADPEPGAPAAGTVRRDPLPPELVEEAEAIWRTGAEEGTDPDDVEDG